MNKSYVTMEQKLCCVCGKEYDTNALLLDRRLKPVFDMHTTTGYGLCPDDQKKYDEGYLALVVSDESRSTFTNGKLTQAGAYRTGVVIHIRRSVALRVFKGLNACTLPMVFINQEVAEHLSKLTKGGKDVEQT